MRKSPRERLHVTLTESWPMLDLSECRFLMGKGEQTSSWCPVPHRAPQSMSSDGKGADTGNLKAWPRGDLQHWGALDAIPSPLAGDSHWSNLIG